MPRLTCDSSCSLWNSQNAKKLTRGSHLGAVLQQESVVSASQMELLLGARSDSWKGFCTFLQPHFTWNFGSSLSFNLTQHMWMHLWKKKSLFFCFFYIKIKMVIFSIAMHKLNTNTACPSNYFFKLIVKLNWIKTLNISVVPATHLTPFSYLVHNSNVLLCHSGFSSSIFWKNVLHLYLTMLHPCYIHTKLHLRVKFALAVFIWTGRKFAAQH